MENEIKELEIDINSILDIPTNIKYVTYQDLTLGISVDTANWIVFENKMQLDFFQLLSSYSIKTSIEKMGFSVDSFPDELNRVIIQIFAKDFCNTTVNSKHPGKFLQLYLTNNCNLRCPHCYLSAGDIIDKEISSKEILDIFDSFVNNSGGKIILTGGEIMLRKDIKQIINYCKQKGLVVEVLSNGVLWTEEFIKWAVGKIDQVQISIDGYNELSNQKVRGKGNFYKALKTIDTLLNYDIPTRLAVTPIYRTDLEKEINKYCDFVRSLLEHYQDKPFDVSFSGDLLDGRYGKLSKEQHEYYSLCIKKIESELYGISENSSFIESIKNHIIADNCAFGQLSVASNGEIYLCPYITNIQSIGNIRDLKKDIIFDISSKASRISHINNLWPCRECELKFICGGGCRIKHFSFLIEGKIPTDQQLISRKCSEEHKNYFYKLMIETNEAIFH